MKIATAVSELEDVGSALAACVAELRQKLGSEPSLVLGALSATRDADACLAAMEGELPETPYLLHTSCQGVMTEKGFFGSPHAVALWGIYDPGGRFAVASAGFEDSPRAAAEAATASALDRTGLVFERPGLIWLTASPGAEEDVIEGIAAVTGGGVPVFGGSSADDTVEGHWFQVSPDGVTRQGVSLALLTPSGTMESLFHNGYTPTEKRGLVTSVEGRVVAEIDGRPALEVYDEWTGQSLGDLPEGSSVLMNTTLAPLGRTSFLATETPMFLLSHPAFVQSDKKLELFTVMSPGDEIVCMWGSESTLVDRAARVAESVSSQGELTGGLLTYCAGCRLTVGDSMHDVARGVNEALGGRPFLGHFTFGEQGQMLDGPNQHGNLMVSMVGWRPWVMDGT